MKTVIRIEHNCGIGLWRAVDENGHDYIDRATCCEDIQTRCGSLHTPREDNLNPRLDNKKWFCAFKTIEQMQEWLLTNEIKEIILIGFKIWMLDIIEYQEGLHQVIYTKESILQKKDITSLFI